MSEISHLALTGCCCKQSSITQGPLAGGGSYLSPPPTPSQPAALLCKYTSMPADTTYRQPALVWAPDSQLYRVLASWQERSSTAALQYSITEPSDVKSCCRKAAAARTDIIVGKKKKKKKRYCSHLSLVAAFTFNVIGLKQSSNGSGSRMEFVWCFLATTLLTFPWAMTPDDALYSSDSPEVINSWLRGIMRHEHAFVLVTLERLTNLSNWVLVNTIVPTLFQCQFAHVCWWVLAQYLWVFTAAVGRYYDNLFIWELFGSRRRRF